MVYIDLHAHLDFKDFDKDRSQIIDQMQKANIIALTNTLNHQNYIDTLEIFKDTSQVLVCPGLYPQDAETITDEQFAEYLRLIKKNKKNIIAIGEVGLDRHHTTEPTLWEVQEKRFRQLIELAIKLDKPLIVHTRKAEERTLEIIEEYVQKFNFRKFDLHCFSGKKKLIQKIRDLRIFCSIPLIVYNTQSFQELVKELPITQLLAETDSPFLHPEKIRNSSLNIPQVYEKIAEIKGLDKKEIESILYRNYMSLTL